MEVEIPKALKDYNIMVLRGHGVFSRGTNLEEAYNWVTVLEESSTIIFKCIQLGMDILKIQGQYEQW
jgi:ribulose-5-phosphate 4-epimerase/fuculose-1-phosphate aldolase